LIWARAEGSRVWDADGREYLDLSAGFGVAALGHRNGRVMEAIARAPVAHALGDLADGEVTAELRSSLPWPSKLGVTGADAVEIGLRTALLVTGRRGIVAFDGAYHGTSLLPLAATGFERFREPFAAWLPGLVYRRPFGEDPGELPADAACVIVEPVQGRAGARVPPDGFLETLFTQKQPDSLRPGMPMISYSWQKTMAQMGLDMAPPLEIVGVMPHMHQRGRTSELHVQSGGQDQCLARVDNWNFHWQKFYFYKTPRPGLGADSQLRLTCDYDTSQDHDPVYPGWGTRNEMCLDTLMVVPRQGM